MFPDQGKGGLKTSPKDTQHAPAVWPEQAQEEALPTHKRPSRWEKAARNVGSAGSAPCPIF